MPVAQKLRGVGGVLGGLISPEPAAPVPQEAPAPLPPPSIPAEEARAEPEALPSPPAAAEKPRQKPQARPQARRGRPPGQRAGEAAEKEKVTLRLPKELMDDYREWSWEERCQLGELVERALIQYRKRRPGQKGD
jgi:uncharacterized protein (DUF4415 family)